MNKFLRSTHQIPIFRFVDGYSKMKENQNSLEEAIDKLNEGKNILVFAEGTTEALMKCRRIQKGTAKIAFMTFEAYPDKEIEILPVGINFENWYDPGSEVVLNIGTPFSANTYYREDTSPRGIINLTQDIEAEMKKLIIHVKDQHDEDYIRKYWQMLNLSLKEWPRKDTDTVIAARLKACEGLINDGHGEVKNLINNCYQEASNINKGKRILGVYKWWKNLLLPIGIPGLIYHLLPVSYAYYFRNNKVRRDAFKAPILGIVSFLSSLVLYIITLVVGSITWGWWQSLLLVLMMMLSGFAYVLWWENTKKINISRLSTEFRSKMSRINQLVDDNIS